jgi:hypothetical protein
VILFGDRLIQTLEDESRSFCEFLAGACGLLANPRAESRGYCLGRLTKGKLKYAWYFGNGLISDLPGGQVKQQWVTGRGAV